MSTPSLCVCVLSFIRNWHMALHPVSTGQEKGDKRSQYLHLAVWGGTLQDIPWTKRVQTQTALVELLVFLQWLHFVVLHCNMSSQRWLSFPTCIKILQTVDYSKLRMLRKIELQETSLWLFENDCLRMSYLNLLC